MIRVICMIAAAVQMLALGIFSSVVYAETPASEIGVVVMHGKGGSPNKYVIELAQALEAKGFQVANLDMPWSGRRHYDVDMKGAVNEVTAALDGMRAKGAKKLFVAGHSQGAAFGFYYAGQQAVDGLIAIAPGGFVDSSVFNQALGKYVAHAKGMVEEGRGNEKAAFADYEGSRGTNGIMTSAEIYLSWFDFDHGLVSKAIRNVKPGTPVLYVAPTGDYPALRKRKDADFGAIPGSPLNRLYEPESSHLAAPDVAKEEIIRWITQVAN